MDTTSPCPPEALKPKPNVGYFRQPSPEGVIGLAPSVTLAVEGSGPKEAVAVVQSASIPLVSIPDKFDGEGIVEKIKMIAKAVDAERQGECLSQLVAADLTALASLQAGIRAPCPRHIYPLIHEWPTDGGWAWNRCRWPYSYGRCGQCIR